eukprot:403348792
MQQLTSVSLTSELQSETVQKGVRGATYDPLTETLFAASEQGKQSDRATSIIISISDKPQSEEAKHSSQSHPANPKEHSSQSFRSLAETQSERRVVVSEANPKGLPQYLAPFLLADRRADEPEYTTTDTLHEPDCLRFCPANSSGGVEISLSGFTAVAKLQSQTARANKAFSEGVHYWEIICPISCQTLQIGVSNKNQKEEVVQQFRTTTPRVIGIELNLDKLTLNFWLNGRFIKERAKKVPAGQTWYPSVKFKEPEYFVIINPFAQGKGDLPEEVNSNHLPSSLRTSEIQLLNSYLTTKLKGMLVIYGLNQEMKENFETELKKTLRLDGSFDYKFLDSYELLYQEQSESEQKPDTKVIKAALLNFKNYYDSVKYYHHNKEFKMLYDKQLATLIQLRNSKEKSGDIPQELGQNVYEILLQKVYNQDDKQQEFLINSGLSVNNTVDKLAKVLTQLSEVLNSNIREVKHQNMGQESQSFTDIQYIDNSDKMLLTNGSQIKLISRSGTDFDLASNSSFTNYPQKPEDLISLKISKSDINFLITNLDWNQVKPETYDMITLFLENLHQLNNNFDNGLNVPYQIAFTVVKSLLNISIAQYENLENQLCIIQDQDIAQVKNVQQRVHRDIKPQFNNEIQLPFEYGNLSLVDANQMLAILLKLEDQLWAATQSDQVASSLKSLWSSGASSTSSRRHTAFGRLSSLITYPTQTNTIYDPISMAELGLVNIDDKYGKLQFYQEFKVELENIFERSNQNQIADQDLRFQLAKQFPQNLLLKGLSTWNVPINETLNSMPPQVHDNNLEGLKQNYCSIDSVKSIQNSDLILTGSKDGSINIWSSKLRLQKISGLNLKLKLYQEKEIDQLLIANHSSQEELKQDDQSGCNVKILTKKGQKVKVINKAKPVEEEITEDLLFTMFNEAQEDLEEVVIDDSLEVENQNLEVLSKYLLDYTDTPLHIQQKKQEKAKEEAAKVVEEEKKADPNEEVKREKQETEKPVEPSQEILNQMIMMGFGLEASKISLVRTKNESLSAALDIIIEVQKELDKDKKADPILIKIVSYQCEVCTYINPEGNSICEVCGSAAPQTSYVQEKLQEQIEKEKELEEKKKKEQEDLIIKAQEEEQKRILEEQMKLERELEEQRKQDELRRQTVEYYENTEIRDFIFATVNSGKSVKPILTGAVMQNKTNKTVEIEVHSLNYKQSYLSQFIGTPGKYCCKVCDIPFKNEDSVLHHLFSCHQSLVECFYPTFIGSQLIQNKWIIKTNRLNQNILRDEMIGRIMFPFENLIDFIQVGTNLEKDNSIYFIGIGQKTDQQQISVIIERVDYNQDTHDFNFVTLSDDSQLFKQVGINNDDIQKVHYCQKSQRIVVISQSQSVQILDIDTSDKKLHLQKVDQFNLIRESEKFLKLENGVIYICVENQKLRRYLIDEKQIRLLQEKEQALKNQNQNTRKDALTEEEVLSMQIDQHQVTINDILRYEKLMNGKTVLALSNSTNGLLTNNGANKSVHQTNHVWTINDTSNIGPLEMQFQKPTSLISLNIDLTFNVNDSAQLLELLQKNQAMIDASQPISQKASIIDTATTVKEKKSENTVNLGLLSIQGINHESLSGHNISNQQKIGQQQSQSQEEHNFMPLVVNHHKGASYNQSYQVCRIVTDNSLIFASNYPKPEFFFKHLHGHKMNIEKFTIRSSTNSKCGAYPIGSGIIFISDHLQAFEHTLPFHKFTLQDYNDWKQLRLKDPTPLRPYEPVSYFEFESETSVSVDIDFQRSCKYIMLKPTGFRKKPTQFSQNINNVPMELEFFGVSGNSSEDANINLGSSSNNIIAAQGPQQIFSNYELDLRVLESKQQLKLLSNIEVQSIMGFDLQISGQTLAKMSINDLKKLKLVAKTSLKLTDSHLQLQHISGLSLNLKDILPDGNMLQLRGVSIQGIVAEEDSQLSDQQRPIFNQGNIPVSYMRSCLLSPKYFNIINKVLAQMTSDQQYSQQLRMTIIQFLNKIMKIDREFIHLIYNEIDLTRFLHLNLFSRDSSGLQLTVEFLQNFQRDFDFCNKLFNLLIEQIEQLPQTYISYSGYEALIGLLIWSIPLNPEKTVQTLLQTLYSKICLQKIPLLQTREAITFRTRYNINSYPFDLVSFKNNKQNQNAALVRKESLDQSHQFVSQESSSKVILSVEQIRKFKYDYHQIYEVQFKRPTQVTDIKLFLANQEQVQFKIIVKIFSNEDEMIYYNTFDEQIFAQLASMAYQKVGQTNPSDDCLHISNLNFSGLGLKVLIEFGLSNSSLPKGSKNKPPDSMIEVYGSCSDLAINQAKIKKEIDEKAREFWQRSAKLIKVGKSMQMLQIANSVEEFLIVPQVSSISTFIPPKDTTESQQTQINTSTKPEINISHLAPNRINELQVLQEELKGKIRANDTNVKELVDKIQHILHQSSGIISQEISTKDSTVQSLEFYMTLTSDFTKIIRNMVKSKILTREKLQQIVRELDPSEDLSKVCFELFKKYVVYDSGAVRSDIQEFISVCLSPLMSQSEIRAFSFLAIEEFLSTPQSSFSQKAVLDALTYLGIPEGELVSFLIQKLGITLDLKQIQNPAVKQTQLLSNQSEKMHPFIFMSSVMMLVLSQLKQIVIPLPGQTYHKGVKCSGCNAKMILGWRYKCGHCVQDMNFDQACMEKHLIENPDHVMLVIKEPIEQLSKKQLKLQKSVNAQLINKAILPPLNFKELAPVSEQGKDADEVVIHLEQNCENCGKKSIQGKLYKCVNCEEYNLCSECFTQNKSSHYQAHIFAEIRKPQDQSNKNPIMLMQILDARLYPEAYKSTEIESPTKIQASNIKKEEEKDDDFEELKPLNISRSLSQPTPLKKLTQSKVQTKNELNINDTYMKLDYDQQFIVMFHTCVWISQDIQNSFQKQEKIVLMKLTIETMLHLIKLTNIKHIESVISNKDAFFQILVSILQLNSQDLIQLFKNLFDLIRQPPSAIWIPNMPDQDEISLMKKSEFKEQQKAVLNLLEILVSHLQNFLKWMINLALQPDIAKLQSQQSHQSWTLLLKSYQNQKVWLNHLQLIVELFIKTTDEIKKDQNLKQNGEKQINGGLEKIPEDQNENDDEDLAPLNMARSVSLPLKNQGSYQQTQNTSLQIIKNMVQLLYLSDNQQINQANSTLHQKGQRHQTYHFTENESQTKYLSQMWSLVLKTLTSVNVNQLIEAKIFDSLVNAFLISSEDIKQITFPQILAITETIAKQSVNSNDISKFICNLLFLTLENVTGNHHEKVGYSICQGWLDILITSSVARVGNYESTNTVYAKLSNEELSVFMKKTAQYLINHLNKGSFEGVTGAQSHIVMRLNIASDLMYVIVNAESKDHPGQKALAELFKGVQANQKIKRDYSDSVNNLLAWLFLNARLAKDDIPISQLGNACNLTPATQKVKQITEQIEEVFQILGDNGEHAEEAIRIGLNSLSSISRKLNKTLVDLTQTNSIGFELSVKLSERTNEYFIKLLGLWLVNDKIASYFVFDLNGFEFLLDQIGINSESESGLQKLGQTRMDIEQIDSSINVNALTSQQDKFQMSGSDLVDYLESNHLEFQQTQSNVPQGEEIEQSHQVTSIYENNKQLFVQEFSKSISMVDNNGQDAIASFQKTDWSVNKRAYKHRVIHKILTGQLRSEYWISFSLPQEIELREIQIAFNNYWAADTEIYAEPLSVLVEAGMDEKNLSLVCNLDIVKDDAFGSVSATVFGQNLQSFQGSAENVHGQILDVIQHKLQSIQNFKIKYIKFCMRRNILTCLENSPLSTKFTKPVAFGINYISLLGYDLTKVGDYLTHLKQEQKKTALEVLSIICSGDFKSILKVIAQQPKTIEKMKESFNMLASLVSVKENLIEPTFIAISTYNNEMGDWIINQFLKSPNLNKHASLIGQIIICNKTELPRRLRLLQDHVINQLRTITQEDRSTYATSIKKWIPYIQIFIETLRIAAPDIQNIQSEVDIHIKESCLIDIVNLLSTSTQEREQQSRVLIQLLVLILCPPQPFVNSLVDIYEFTLKHLLGDNQLHQENLASILSATKTQIAQEILRRGNNLDKLLKLEQAEESSVEGGNSQLQQALKFWINVSQDKVVRNTLAEDKISLKLYENLRQDHPEKNNKIIRKDSVIGEQELYLMVELIKQLSAGYQNLEQELANSLMKDLEHLSRIRDMDFVNKVFLQLLRTEKTLPVCLWPYDSENNKWIPNYKPLNALENKSNQSQSLHNTFVPSQLLQGEKRSVFIKNFKEVLGQHSKTNVKKLLSSNWTLAHTQTEQGSSSQFQSFWKNIENKQPIVILISGTSPSGGNVTYGCYCSKGIPQIPANLAQDSDYPVASSPEDFVFCYIDDHSFHHFAPKPSVPIISMFTDYEGGGAISVANDFMLMSYSYDFVFTVGIVYDIEKILLENNPKPEKEVENTVTFQKFEIWTTDLTKQPALSLQPGTSQISIPAPILQPSKLTQKLGDSADLQISSSLSEVKHPWYNMLNPYVNFRSNPVFMVPSHLTMNQLSKIMLQSSVTFKVRVGQNHHAQAQESLEELYQQILENQRVYESQNGIVDLEYEINQLLGSQEENKEEESQNESDLNSHLIQGYVPKMGLFEQFETQGGVKLIISVTLQSMKLWKSEEQSKSWELWLKELESFSEIPLFFQLFLKNSKCKDLLFKVLAGQPDQEINTGPKPDAAAQQKWEEEQKSAVQFNYKILSEAFSISDDLKLREIGIKCGLLPTILERLGAISGEKPRVYEESPTKVEEEKVSDEPKQEMLQLEKNVEKKKRKGVGYSSKVGQTFNVTQYLENKKLRNDQIKNLVDICSNFINCKEWKAGDDVTEIILESALLPLLESVFRNGSWLDMAKEYEVYHSYLALTRAIATQKNLVKCLSEIDPKYKPQQTDPIYRLLSKLNDLADIFINCLNQQQKSEQVNKQKQLPDKIDIQPIYPLIQKQPTSQLLENNQHTFDYINPTYSLPNTQPISNQQPMWKFMNDYKPYQNQNNTQQNQNTPSQYQLTSNILPDFIMNQVNSYIPHSIPKWAQANPFSNKPPQSLEKGMVIDPLFQIPKSQKETENMQPDKYSLDMLTSSFNNKPSTPPDTQHIHNNEDEEQDYQKFLDLEYFVPSPNPITKQLTMNQKLSQVSEKNDKLNTDIMNLYKTFKSKSSWKDNDLIAEEEELKQESDEQSKVKQSMVDQIKSYMTSNKADDADDLDQYLIKKTQKFAQKSQFPQKYKHQAQHIDSDSNNSSNSNNEFKVSKSKINQFITNDKQKQKQILLDSESSQSSEDEDNLICQEQDISGSEDSSQNQFVIYKPETKLKKAKSIKSSVDSNQNSEEENVESIKTSSISSHLGQLSDTHSTYMEKVKFKKIQNLNNKLQKLNDMLTTDQEQNQKFKQRIYQQILDTQHKLMTLENDFDKNSLSENQDKLSESSEEYYANDKLKQESQTLQKMGSQQNKSPFFQENQQQFKFKDQIKKINDNLKLIKADTQSFLKDSNQVKPELYMSSEYYDSDIGDSNEDSDIGQAWKLKLKKNKQVAKEKVAPGLKSENNSSHNSKFNEESMNSSSVKSSSSPSSSSKNSSKYNSKLNKLQKIKNQSHSKSGSSSSSSENSNGSDGAYDSYGSSGYGGESDVSSEQDIIPNLVQGSWQKEEKNKQDTGLMDSEIPENLARDVIKTFKIVQAAVSKLFKTQKDENYIENALNLPLDQCYKALLTDMRFDYMEMKDPNDASGQQYKHHYNTIAQQNLNPPSSKMVRLAQELADLSNALPYEHTNAIFVRVDSQRVDMMKALICGASNTPYAHGCYEYDIFCDNNYPREPPKMNLITTGNGSVRFNPNLYACGKVCLSLLGTWRGSATENWDPKLSTILQVLLSTQAIIMSEEVYFNEPGFENEAGTPEGEKKNEGYQNIVRYCNIKFAMIEQLKRPAKGFESAVKRHFYIKKTEILKEVHQWVELAEKNEATYGGLVNDHNYTWANQFKATKTKYKEMLVAAVQQLEEELNKLERPTDYELKHQQDLKKRQQQAKNKKKRQGIAEGKEDLDNINVDYEDENEEELKKQKEEEDSTQINTETNTIDITDEKVKDRWSRYIGAMGVEAVAKQANANIFLSGAGALGIEIAKNLVLSGCKSFTLHDYRAINIKDLSGQFFINYEEDVLNEKKKKGSRGEACMPRLKQLNHYVKCQLAPVTPIPLNIEDLEKAPWNLHLMDVVILTESTYAEQIFINNYCRSKGKKFISADAYGVFTRVFNDFGDKFEVLDTTGEELLDVMIKSISNEPEGLVELLPNTRHKLQDGDEVVFSKIEGMELKPEQTHEEPFEKCTSINETIHRVKVLTPYAFRIGDTTKYTPYLRNGLAKQLKTKKLMQFKSFQETMCESANIPQDENLQYADFEKIQNSIINHVAFEALDTFKKSHDGQMPGVWNRKDAEEILSYAKEIAKRYPDMKSEEQNAESFETKFIYLFSFTCQGVFNPLCAFLGGFVAQECVKAITQKFVPTSQVFYYDALEVLPTFDPKTDFTGPEEIEQGGDNKNYFEDVYVKTIAKTQEIGHRSDGLRVIVGADLIEKLAYTRLFMVGAGAIGCELLKNYAMLGVGVGRPNPGKKQIGGAIVLTDPDVIEVSNLNRQFLFREKHLRKPKSSTAAAAAIYMNKELKENIIARLDKVHEGTSHIYTDQFFEDLTVVTNALDNVNARRYIDARCVTAKTALLESGTLGPKGHVQVVIPFITESYGSQNDPEDTTEIPHCTLKMFPEETLHCVEWARDKFGKIFTQNIQNTIKILDEGKNFQPMSQQDTMSLKEGLKIIEKRPKSFEDCIEYARLKFEKFFNHDVRQLLHVYPLDAKTKDGNLFWSLPKRPPVPVDFDPTNPLHCLFVTSFACLRANTFKVPIPDANPRTEQFRLLCGLKANSIKVPAFVPNDEKAKEIQASVQKEAKEEEKKESEETKEIQTEEKIDPNDTEALMKKFLKIVEQLPQKEGKINTEELLSPELFEKDNDANFHIDFIYAMANCRSTNYKLDEMDWITVKLKAGRIVPALSTTTSCVAGLQTLELIKLLKNCKKADHRNIFMNMAVPFLQATEPADVLKTKLTEDIEVNLWTRWDINLGKDVTLQQVIDKIDQTYKGLEVRDVLRGNAPLYFHAIMNAPGKEHDREKVLKSKVFDLVGADSDDKYVDIAVTCVRKPVKKEPAEENKQEEEVELIDTSVKKNEDDSNQSGEQILSGVPPVRVHFE